MPFKIGDWVTTEHDAWDTDPEGVKHLVAKSGAVGHVMWEDDLNGIRAFVVTWERTGGSCTMFPEELVRLATAAGEATEK